MTRTEIETWLAGPGRKHVEAAAKDTYEHYIAGKWFNADMLDREKFRSRAIIALTAFLTSMLEDGTASHLPKGSSLLFNTSVLIIKLEAQQPEKSWAELHQARNLSCGD
jgi:hypothetical protein